MKKGFTIVEVLVVIGIIAILTVIIFPSISNIRAKNRDAEKVADISAIQLGLSLYKNQQDGVYPETLGDINFSPRYVPGESLLDPIGDPYTYVPLSREINGKCTYYHLGTELELSTGQIDTADNFDSRDSDNDGVINSGIYYWCGVYSGPGIGTSTTNFNVHP